MFASAVEDNVEGGRLFRAKVDVVFPAFEHSRQHVTWEHRDDATRLRKDFDEYYGFSKCHSGKDIVERSFDLGCCASWFDGRVFCASVEAVLGIVAERRAVTQSPSYAESVDRRTRLRVRTDKYAAYGFDRVDSGKPLVSAIASRLRPLLRPSRLNDLPDVLLEHIAAFLVA